MAYEIGQKLVKDTTEYNNYAYGITIPIQRGNTGYFNQAFTSFEQAKSNLRNLLSTKQGERVMQPLFGTGLHALLFEPMTDVFEEKLQTTITESVNYWLPYINIDDIDILMTDEMKDRYTAEMNIKFTIGTNIDVQEITFTIQG